MNHRDLAAIVAALYTASPDDQWLYLSNQDANVVMGIVRQDGYLIIALRGSYTEMDWFHDLWVKEMDPAGRQTIKRVHSGGYSGTPEAADIVRLHYRDGDKVIIIGHSLGGGRAEIVAEHMGALGILIHLVVTWGAPAFFKPSTMPPPSYPFVAYRNVVVGDPDDVTRSTDLVGYRYRIARINVSAPPAARIKLDPFNLHHFALYQSVTPATEV